MNYKNINDFIHFKYKDMELTLYIAFIIILSVFNFLILLFHSEKKYICYVSVAIAASYIVAALIVRISKNKLKIKFLTQGYFLLCICITAFIFISGFMNNPIKFLMIELILLWLMQIVYFIICCFQIKKRAYNTSTDNKVSPLIPMFGVLGVVFGRFVFAFIDIPNAVPISFIIILILLFSFGTIDLFRLALLYIVEKKKTTKFIIWLENDLECKS